MNDNTPFEAFKASLAQFMGQTSALVGHALSDQSKTAHLTPMIPWVVEAMSASMDPHFLESIALGPVHMGMTATSTPAQLKIMELDGLSEGVRQPLRPGDGPGTTQAQFSLLKLCGMTVCGLLNGTGDMASRVNGILRSTLGAIDVARNCAQAQAPAQQTPGLHRPPPLSVIFGLTCRPP